MTTEESYIRRCWMRQPKLTKPTSPNHVYELGPQSTDYVLRTRPLIDCLIFDVDSVSKALGSQQCDLLH